MRRELDLLKGHNNQLRESVAATQRYETLLQFKEQSKSQTVAAQVIEVAAQLVSRSILNSVRTAFVRKWGR
ncbi:MAG: hypothetical protein U0231_11050 [Nitrospiraceae bacterium]